jgi:hypothetical protein
LPENHFAADRLERAATSIIFFSLQTVHIFYRLSELPNMRPMAAGLLKKQRVFRGMDGLLSNTLPVLHQRAMKRIFVGANLVFALNARGEHQVRPYDLLAKY